MYFYMLVIRYFSNTQINTKQKKCTYKGCTNNAKKGGVCIRHGAQVKRYQGGDRITC